MLPTVFFFVSPMCGACEEAKPAIDAFIATRAQGRCFAVKLNPSFKAYRFGRWSIRYTPSYLLLDENRQPARFVEGRVLGLEEIEEFAFGNETTEE